MRDFLPIGDVPGHYARAFGHDRWCLDHDGEALSWGELERRANQRAWALSAQGVGQDDLIVLALPNGNALFELTFALWKLGATPCMISWKLPFAEVRQILEVARPREVIAVDPELSAAVGALPFTIGLDNDRRDPYPTRIAKHWKAIPSGGSTGRPKIIVDHSPAVLDLATPPILGLPEGKTVLNPGPCYHNAPFLFSHAALGRGNSVVGMTKFDPLRALQLIEKHRVAWVNFVPTMMNRMWRLPEEERSRFDLSSLEAVWHMAAPMPQWLKQAWIEWIGAEKIWELYGGTEALGSTIINGTEWLDHRGSVGRPVNAELRILDEEGERLPAGEIGEIFLKPNEGSVGGYHYLGAMAKSTPDGFQSLGDFGWVDADGYLYIADRRTDLIISGGANIYPAEVESALMQHPAVECAVVIGLPDDDLGARVHAIVQRDRTRPGELSAEELAAFAAQLLVRYKVPRSFEITDEPLRDEAGKVRRSALREARVAANVPA